MSGAEEKRKFAIDENVIMNALISDSKEKGTECLHFLLELQKICDKIVLSEKYKEKISEKLKSATRRAKKESKYEIPGGKNFLRGLLTNSEKIVETTEPYAVPEGCEFPRKDIFLIEIAFKEKCPIILAGDRKLKKSIQECDELKKNGIIWLSPEEAIKKYYD